MAGLIPRTGKKAFGDTFAIHHLRLAARAAHVETGGVGSDDAREDVVLIPKVLVTLPGEKSCPACLRQGA